MLLGADPWEPQEHKLPRNHGAALQQAQQAQMQCEATICDETHYVGGGQAVLGQAKKQLKQRSSSKASAAPVGRSSWWAACSV